VASVLEIGCGAGGNAAWLRANGARRLVGIDIDGKSIEAAKAVLDAALEGRVEDVLPTLNETFDLVVCADVLEHLVDPTAVLREVRNHMTSDGTLLVSIPNIRHFRSLARIAWGRGFSPDPEGVFDATHLRFFTRDNVREMLRASEFEPMRWGWPPPHRLALLRRRVTRGPVAEYFAYQWFVEARPLRARAS
jgi:2-polyprenyl-3-methyl-5-hydroxy-6-metoxy-1,4-benzoquinol methylase